MSDWARWANGELECIRQAGRWREMAAFDGGMNAEVSGSSVVNFASNDYLGLSRHPAVCAAARDAIERYGTGATASRLIVGTRPVHLALETAIADWQGVDRALVFPSGYAANLAVLTTMGRADTTLFSDALNHASIIDGCRLAGARVQIFRHADTEHLEALLRVTSGRKIVVTDSVFSMDGDLAPLATIARLCVRHGSLLIVDEAHQVLAGEALAIPGLEVLRVGTLSKTLGALGGWVAGSRALIELLMNRGRSFIFTTGLSPADTAAALAALRIYCAEEGSTLRQELRRLIDQLVPGHPSPIVPIVIGDDSAAVANAQALLQEGLWVPAIRPPTVPVGTSRLRIAVSAAHSDSMIGHLKGALARLIPDYRERLHAPN